MSEQIRRCPLCGTQHILFRSLLEERKALREYRKAESNDEASVMEDRILDVSRSRICHRNYSTMVMASKIGELEAELKSETSKIGGLEAELQSEASKTGKLEVELRSEQTTKEALKEEVGILGDFVGKDFKGVIEDLEQTRKRNKTLENIQTESSRTIEQLRKGCRSQEASR
ncbi:uncharacterized protein BDZ99DRAFT_562311 [Mytilinidion resinicola]|uniref:Uncharacterized protein n=1 Tax=Mytilinidion resinicola TaxID=574789 RepID=A0A6A6YQP9_9PEZI|nr:uncharacterized protein BDZ99DRAFT_562311 [Mytilinidion resinicola]KAF2811236.1 hypothetical protein BDZ99DRAFT_562311 [Mytilinidion resinicola]